jgi:MFS family permease
VKRFHGLAAAGGRTSRLVSHLLAGWRTGLSRPVLILQAGNALNYFGYGLVLPFEIIYLHQMRGLSTSTAGLVLAATMGTAAIATPPTGALLDRYSPTAIVIAGSLASALGCAGFAFVDRPWQALGCSIVSGAGLGAAGTANRVLVITLVEPEQRAASVALGRVAGNVGMGAGSTVAGFLVASAPRLGSFQLLYLVDAVTYAGFALIVLVAVPISRAEVPTAPDADGAGFRAVARDRLFVTVIAANIVLVVVGHTFFSNILAPFARSHTPVGPGAIGIIFLVNTSFVVIAQIPAVRLVARLRRTHAFAAASVLFAIGLLAVLPATLIHSELAAAGLLATVAIVFAMGECVHVVVLGPLVADLAPAHLLGRYMSLYGLTFTVSLALGPAMGGLLLQTSPDAVWWGGALAAVLAGAVLLGLGHRIPDPLRAAQDARDHAAEGEHDHDVSAAMPAISRPHSTADAPRSPTWARRALSMMRR